VPQDLQNLEVVVDNLGRGDLVHEAKYHIGMLRQTMIRASEKGWTDYFLKAWSEEILEIQKIINKVKIQKAKDQDFL